MAALNRPTTANYEVHENVRVDTHDNEDHTFCGILFPIRIKQDLPISQLVLHSVAVRGRLGPMTVWVSNEDAPTGPPLGHNPNNHDPHFHHFRLQPRFWTKVYEHTHPPSMRRYQTLDFSSHPVVLKPGTVRAIYIHSRLEGDEAIVYDNTRHPNTLFGWGARPPATRRQELQNTPPRYQDNCLAIYTGKAHLSSRPFGQTNIWGWDNAWRDYREFVGQIRYGTVYRLWQPQLHLQFGGNFDQCARALLGCQRRWESPLALLPDECIFYILNMCRWDWFDDTGAGLKQQRRARKAQRRALEAQARAREQEEQAREAQRAEDQAARDAVVAAAAEAATRHPPSGCTLAPDGVETSASTCASAAAAHANHSASSDSEFFDARQDPSESFHPNDNNDDDDAQEEDVDMGRSDQERAAEEDTAAADDDDDDDEEWQEEEDDEHEEEEDGAESDDSDGLDRANGYRANPSYLSHRYISSDEEEEAASEEEDDAADREREQRHAWFRRHFARIRVLRALAQAENGGNDDNGGDDNDSDSDNDGNGGVVYMRLD